MPTIAQRLSPILSGCWVAAEYLEAVARTRSPEKSFDHTPSPVALVIAPFATQKDSVEIGAGYGLHEGGNLTLLLEPMADNASLKIRHDYSDEAGTFREISRRISGTDTTLLLCSRDRKTRRLRYQTVYQRTGSGTPGDLEAAVERGINKLLLARQYRGTDSLGQPVQAQFRLDGTVTGLPFKKYVIQTDFTGPNSGDEIIFDVYTKQQQSLAASFGRDTLKLYTIHSSTGVPAGQIDPDNVFSQGRLRYQLVRVK